MCVGFFAQTVSGAHARRQPEARQDISIRQMAVVLQRCAWREICWGEQILAVYQPYLRLTEKAQSFSNVREGFVYIIKKRVNTKLFYFMSILKTLLSH